MLLIFPINHDDFQTEILCYSNTPLTLRGFPGDSAVKSLPASAGVLVTQSSSTLHDPKDCSPVGSSGHGIFQARILEWVSVPFSRGSSQPKDQSWVSCIAGRFFTIWDTREVHQLQETNAAQSLGQEDPLEKEMATPLSILAWENLWTEEPGGLQFVGSRRVRQDLATKQQELILSSVCLYSLFSPIECSLACIQLLKYHPSIRLMVIYLKSNFKKTDIIDGFIQVILLCNNAFIFICSETMIY